MAVKLLIFLLGTIMFVTICGHPMPDNEPTIPEISIPAEPLKEAHAKTNTSNAVPTEDHGKSINEEESQEKPLPEQVNENDSTEQLNEKVSNKNSPETQAQGNGNPVQPAVMIQTNDQPSDANKQRQQQQNQQDVITTPQQVQRQTPSRQENPPNTQLSQEIPNLQTVPELQQQQPNRLYIVIPAPSNQLPTNFPFQPLYFNSSQRLSQPQFIFNQPSPMLPMLSFPSMMFPSQQFPAPAFITVQPGTKTEDIPRPLQPNQQLGGMAQPNLLPTFYVPPNTPYGNVRPPFPMVFSPPVLPQLPQFVLHSQQTSPSDTVIGQSSVYLGQPNQNQEFILIRTK
ncbi:unnamed protein product [Parnassius apollo]|uniref:(apollo) hypothetical protein n=1 Tax=Parnassius apollo TaxID=110799 RepID=A0A8S3W2D5_PARAO|nr:unnamed protein product [Parnassius apollo]